MRHSIRLCLVLALAWCAAAVADTRVSLDIKPQPMRAALKAFGDQTGLQILYRIGDVSKAGITSPPVSGELTPKDALDRLLANSGLRYEFINEKTVRITTANLISGVAEEEGEQAAPAMRLAQGAQEQQTAAVASAQEVPTEKGIPEVLVKGSKVLNMDIQRSRDDVQPYVVFEREQIVRSGATNLEDFLRQRLTMNTQATSNTQVNSSLGNTSNVNLRGLGVNQTLILLDGRRFGNTINSANIQQADINGIPLGAIERIEVLPSTASGIYGGGATGGVINIVLRRDYSGAEFKLTYENSFSSDSALRRADFNTGFDLEGGKTNVLLSAMVSDQHPLLTRDRDYLERGIATIRANNPNFYATASNPPLGSTANIRSSTGAPLTLRGTGLPLNATITSVPLGYGGPATDNGAGLRTNAGTYNFAPANSAQAGAGGLGLLTVPEIASFSATVRREFGSHVQAFLDTSGFENKSEYLQNRTSANSSTFSLAAGAAGNPFNEAIRVSVPIAGTDAPQEATSTDRRIVGGVIVQLPKRWRAEADYSWNRSKRTNFVLGEINVTTAGAAVTSGALNIFRDPALFPLDVSNYRQPPTTTLDPFRSTFRNFTGRLAGPLLSLPGGSASLSSLLERRNEDFDANRQFFAGFGVVLQPAMSQSTSSVYLETQIPLFSAANRVFAINALELQLAGRFDDYAVHAAGFSAAGNLIEVTNKDRSANPTVGLRYEPIAGVALRASYGTGFLPPTVAQLVPSLAAGGGLANPVIDTRRGNLPTTILVTQTNGNPVLRPEESESYSAGIILNPSFVPGLRVSVDYTRIDKSDNISSLSTQTFVDNELALPGRIVRGSPVGDPFGIGPLVSLDATLVNVSKSSNESYDVAVDWTHDTGRFGTWTVQTMATWQTHNKVQLVPSQAVVENVGLFGSTPLKLKGNLGLTWDRGPWSAGWTGRYFDSYRSSTNAVTILNQGNNGRVPSQNYHDVFASYEWGASSSAWLRNMEVQLIVKNIFNTKAPFDANQGHFYSRYGDPRDAVYSLSLRKTL